MSKSCCVTGILLFFSSSSVPFKMLGSYLKCVISHQLEYKLVAVEQEAVQRQAIQKQRELSKTCFIFCGTG